MLATDVGPVINQEAQAMLSAHIENMRTWGHDVFQVPLPADCGKGSFVPPTIIEIDSMAVLQREVFGPVVHVMRFNGDKLDTLIDAINATGYGLTLGLHSRLDDTMHKVVTQAHVGNIYINRNMVGAVVGVQPFGGEGLSGTGPKAGGPLYLHSLSGSERVLPHELGCCVAETLPEPSLAFHRLTKWAAISGWRDLARLCADYAALTLSHSRIDLPGPTGECNILSFAPRGRMLCLAPDIDELLRQFVAVISVEGQVVAIENAISLAILRKLPKDLVNHIELQAQPNYTGLAGILFVGDSADARALRQRLADESGALIPVIQPGRNTCLYPVFRMVLERVVSVNTAAVGGNATLLTLDDD
ncbi:MAG: aldehyde dehydrogenase family protein [Proteobacteria bacterium]|nr:aldehyde dehydrogenase family protein [Pseudomonadota bacterium]